MKVATFSLKKDKYRTSRGSYSRLVNVLCRKCKTVILTYQKDGPGNLRRLYMDRIFYPENLINLQEKNIKLISNLKCKSCGEIIGTPCIYDKEKRKAFRIYQDAVIKKVRKLKND